MQAQVLNEEQRENLSIHKLSEVQFSSQLKQLLEEAKSLHDSGREYVTRMIRFSQTFCRQLSLSYELDGNVSNEHRIKLFAAMGKITKASEDQIISRYRTIGEQAETLQQYSEHIPPCRDTIWEIAKAIKTEQPIDEWIKAKMLTRESTLSEVKKLRGIKTANAKTAPRTHPYPVTLYFQDADAAASILAKPIASLDDFRIASQKSFRSVLKAQHQYALQDYDRRSAA